MSAEIESIAKGESDRDFARRLKDGMRDALAPVTRIMDEARARDMHVQFQLGIDGFGRNVVKDLTVVKVM